MKQIKLYDENELYKRLETAGDPLKKLNECIDWSIFDQKLSEVKPDRTQTPKGGRPPLPNRTMFKIMILQSINNVSDEAMEYLLNDRISRSRFVGMDIMDKAPDSNSIRLFREILTQTEAYHELFSRFNDELEKMGVITKHGSIIDATFVDVPRQRVRKSEYEKIKNGEVPERLLMPGNENEFQQRDLEAHWAKKGEETHFGYKDHVEIDTDSKMIIDSEVTAANAADVNKLAELVDGDTPEVNVDAGYASEQLRAEPALRYPGTVINICARAYRCKPLTESQIENNKDISRVRARIEHVFGYMTYCMGGLFIRTIGLARASCVIALKNLAYNMCRLRTLVKYDKAKTMLLYRCT